MNRKKRCDFFYFVAKKFRFRSRAAFKLIEIEKKFKFLQKSSGIIDLCAAPGSWMQVARYLAPVCTPVIGIDICPIKTINGCKTLEGDINSYFCSNFISKAIISYGKQMNIVLHDGSPKIEAKWATDVYKQNKLVLAAFKFTQKIIPNKGWFVTKIFKSKYFYNLIYFLKFFFNQIFILKPIASRKESVETYLICKRYSKIFGHLSFMKSKIIFRSLTPSISYSFGTFYKKNNFRISFLELILKKNLFFFIIKHKCEKEQFDCLTGTYFYNLIYFKKGRNCGHILISMNWFYVFFK